MPNSSETIEANRNSSNNNIKSKNTSNNKKEDVRVWFLKLTVLCLVIYTVWIAYILIRIRVTTREEERSKRVLLIHSNGQETTCNSTFSDDVKFNKKRYAQLKG